MSTVEIVRRSILNKKVIENINKICQSVNVEINLTYDKNVEI